MTKPTQEEVSKFLHELRESGITNMWGAPSFVQHQFNVTFEEATTYFENWKNSFYGR